MDNRYSRQQVLPQIGKAGQEKLAQAKVLLVGCGALGSIQAELLARAGVGFLRIVDRDIPEFSNLPRQFLYDEDCVMERLPKAIAAAERIRKINSLIHVEAHVADVNSQNMSEFAHGVDIILDGVDNFSTRYLINDYCVQNSIPWVYGAIQGTKAMAMPIAPGHGPCLRCVFPDMPEAGTVPTCEVSGVLNASPAIAASLQVAQVIRILIEGIRKVGEDARLLTVDPWMLQSHHYQVKKDEECPCCGARQFPFIQGAAESRTSQLCGRDAIQISPSQSMSLDLAEQCLRLASIASCQLRKEVLEVHYMDHRLMLFRDGRIIVHGCNDFTLARSLVDRLIGLV